MYRLIILSLFVPTLGFAQHVPTDKEVKVYSYKTMTVACAGDAAVEVEGYVNKEMDAKTGKAIVVEDELNGTTSDFMNPELMTSKKALAVTLSGRPALHSQYVRFPRVSIVSDSGKRLFTIVPRPGDAKSGGTALEVYTQDVHPEKGGEWWNNATKIIIPSGSQYTFDLSDGKKITCMLVIKLTKYRKKKLTDDEAVALLGGVIKILKK